MRPIAIVLLALMPSAVFAQTVDEFPIPTAASQPIAIAAGPDGNLWFTEFAGNRIGSITTAGVVTEFPLPGPGSGPQAITAGPDGALWFTEQAGRIGRITTSGVVTEFALAANSGPIGIAAGPDDALWFTESGSSVGRITVTGQVSHIPIAPFTARTAITAGPDGNLWAGPSGSGVLRISPSGSVTRFPLSVLLDVPSMAAGPDGDVWLARKFGTQFVAYGNVVERLSTEGASDGRADIPPGLPGSLWGIAAGNDGNLWATAENVATPDSIVRTAPDLTTTEFPIPSSHGNPHGICAGPDGAMWFTEKDANVIGRITTGVTPRGASFVPVTACRVGDTRTTGGVIGPSLSSSLTRAISVSGRCGVPASAQALAINVTAVKPTSDGYLVLFGGVGNGPLPPTSVLNYRSAQTRANNAIVSLAPGLKFSVFCAQPLGSADVVVDITGYFQ